ncbi:protein sidekick-2-like isoform X2 [Dysidea avara]|uniref:protein sidekick-2-like isoform X2 n=1 Tax=Dysidea avara TaxID=196820 RepID=UPI0033169D10
MLAMSCLQLVQPQALIFMWSGDGFLVVILSAASIIIMFKENYCQLVLMLLLISFPDSDQQDLDITIPPQDNVVCVGDEVNITCGYIHIANLSPTWIIGGVSHSPSEIVDSNMYHLPVVSNSEDTILTINSVSEEMNETTIQCELPISPPVYSSNGTLTVMGPPTLPIIKALERRLTSLVISWDTFSHTSCGDVTYNVTLSDGTTELVEERTTTSNTISFTDLDSNTQYEVTVLAINNAGPATVVTSNVTTLTPSVPSPPRDLIVTSKFVDYKPVVTLTWNPSPLTDNMPALYGYVVILSGKDRMRTFHQVLSNVTNLSLDDQVELRIREFYTVSVLSLNSIGFSDAIKTYFVVEWLKSVRITLLPKNKVVFVSCDVTESIPPVDCSVTINCTTCKDTTSKVFNGHSELRISPDTDYHISVRVVRADTGEALEDYSFEQTLSVPPRSNSESSSSSSSDDYTIIYIIVVVNAVAIVGVIVGVLVMIVSCALKRRKKRLVTSHYETLFKSCCAHTLVP